jgi:hypothetical protein
MTKRMITAAAAFALMLVTSAVAQQDNRTGLIAYQGSQDMWNQHWSSGTRTDMAPKFEVPAGIKLTNNQVRPTQDGPTPNSVGAWKPEDTRPAECPYTNDEAARMADAVGQAQSEAGATPGVLLQIRSINDNADRRCDGQDGR